MIQGHSNLSWQRYFLVTVHVPTGALIKTYLGHITVTLHCVLTLYQPIDSVSKELMFIGGACNASLNDSVRSTV